MTTDSLQSSLRGLLLLPEKRDADLLQWRISILRSIQLATLTLGLLTMMMHTLFPLPDQQLILIADATTLFCLATLTFWPRLSHQTRAWLFLALVYCFWIWMFSLVGVVSLIYLMTVPLFAATLVGLRAGVIMLTMSCIGLFVMGMAYFPEFIIGNAVDLSALQTWSTILVNFAFCASLLTIACGVLINRLELALALRQQAEEKSRALAEHMQQMEKLQAVGTLASGVAHDFNNILTIIMSLTESIKDKRFDNVVTGQLDQILLSSDRGKEIVRQLLMFSRQPLSDRKLIDLRTVLKQMEPLLRAQVPAGIQFSLLSEDAPGSRLILANASEIQQVMMNLIGNAVLALTPVAASDNNDERRNIKKGEIGITLHALGSDDPLLIQLSLDSQKHYVSITVSDNGIGISAAVISRLFEPFFTTREPGEGTGLGLASSHGIVNSLGGGISVESEPGLGSAFTFALPLAQPGRAHAGTGTGTGPETEPETAPGMSTQPLEQTSILLVDDEPLILTTGTFMLGKAGYTVTAVSSAAKARTALAETDFALIITDYSMPGESGISLIREARALKPGIPVILVSGRGHVNELDDDLAASICVLPKPYKKQDLLNAIAHLLQ